MKKKLVILFIAFVCFVAFGFTIKTNAFVGNGETYMSYPEVVYNTSSDLGLTDVTIDYDVAFGEEMSIVRNGFKFTRSGDIATVEPADDALIVQTLYFNFTIDSKTVAPEQYLNLDYTKFPNVRNVVINCDLQNGILAKINQLQSIQNVYILEGCNLTNLNNPQIKNYVLLENKLSDAYDLASQEFLKLSEYNRQAKFVTIESLKYVALSHLRTYLKNPNYKGTEYLDLTVIKDDDFISGVLPTGYNVNVTTEVNGGYYTSFVLDGYSTNYKVLTNIDPKVTKIIISSSSVDNYYGVYTNIPHYLDQIYYQADNNDVSYHYLHADLLICPSPSYFYYTYYKTFNEVYFYKYGIGAKVYLSIKDESLAEGEEVRVKFKYSSSVEVSNYASTTTLYDAFVGGETQPSSRFEINYNGYKAYTTSSSKKISDLIGVIELYGLGTNNSVTVEELIIEPIDKDTVVNTPVYPDETPKEDETNKPSTPDDDNTQTNPDKNDMNNNTPKPDDDKSEEDKETIKEKVDNLFENFKEKFETNKAVKAVTIVVSVTFGLGLIYLAYVIIKKFTKFFK